MARARATGGVAGLTVLAIGCMSMASAAALAPPPPRRPAPATTTTTAAPTTGAVTVTISGGHVTDPRDNGRPVVLIAAALGVPTEVFRTAFSAVTPARGGEPSAAQVRANKAALLRVLAPYGVTNERLDAVSNHYRYNGSAGQMWPTTPATATATVRNGVVTGISVTSAGSGYSSAPSITVTGTGTVVATATLAFTTSFATNGSIAAITLR